jgi:hypothetical protein
LRLDVFLTSHRLTGLTLHVDESRRLVDVLNNADLTLPLYDAAIQALPSGRAESVTELVVEKRFVLAAAPEEPAELLSRRRMLRAGILRPNLTRIEALVLLPPFTVKGELHVSQPGAGSKLDISGLGRFFPLSEAHVYFGSDEIYSAEVLVINRDHVASIAKASAPPQRQSEPQSRPKPEEPAEAPAAPQDATAERFRAAMTRLSTGEV